MAREYIKFFHELTRHDATIAGGKGASLGEMTRAGIPVPPGFVVLAPAFTRFLEETDIDVEVDHQLHKVNVKEMESVEEASEVLRGLIHKKKMPSDLTKQITSAFQTLRASLVAVRSSATAEDGSFASWAGELESYLNTTQPKLLLHVQKCWSSLFTPRAIFYRFEKKMHKEKIAVAVVVQKMIQSEVSGITFTVHPVTKDKNQMIIEAGWGLGEAIVSGQITPDSYVLEKDDLALLDVNVSSQEKMIVRKGERGNAWVTVPKTKQGKQKLTGKQIVDIANICKTIEKHYGFPCDIEWAYEKGKFYVVQSRPITTL